MSLIIAILCINKEETNIPQESIRFRVIANSNNRKDQQLKKKVVKNLTKELKKIDNNKSINSTRNTIINKLPEFKNIIDKTINNQEYNYSINYGNNYFPEKKYNNKIYKEGEYESLVVTIGKGQGRNFWCVLFPPLCFNKDQQTKKPKSFIKELINKYF